METKRPKVGIGVCIRNGDFVLLGLRKGPHAGGVWAFPGGHLEWGESFEQCAIREVEEETGIQIPRATLWTVENTVYHLEGNHYVVVFMVADLPPGQVAANREPEKCEVWQWFLWDKLPAPMMQGTQKLVARNLNPFEV